MRAATVSLLSATSMMLGIELTCSDALSQGVIQQTDIILLGCAGNEKMRVEPVFDNQTNKSHLVATCSGGYVFDRNTSSPALHEGVGYSIPVREFVSEYGSLLLAQIWDNEKLIIREHAPNGSIASNMNATQSFPPRAQEYMTHTSMRCEDGSLPVIDHTSSGVRQVLADCKQFYVFESERMGAYYNGRHFRIVLEQGTNGIFSVRRNESGSVAIEYDPPLMERAQEISPRSSD